MSSPFLAGLLSLVEADAEVALIPAAQVFLTAWTSAKDGVGRAAAIAQLEGNVLLSVSKLPAEFIGQELPVVNAALQSLLTKAQAIVATPPA